MIVKYCEVRGRYRLNFVIILLLFGGGIRKLINILCCVKFFHHYIESHPVRGAWIEIFDIAYCVPPPSVAPREGCVD